MRVKILAALCALLLCTSCRYMPSGNIEDLLVPPRLSERQTAVYEALESTLNPGNIQYKYPQQGSYRSPFVFYDLDGDGRDEAIVFYAYNSDSSLTRAKILRENEDGSWTSAYDITGEGDEIQFVDFANYLSADAKSILIGWQSSRYSTLLQVYSFADGAVRDEGAVSCEAYLTQDFDGNGISEILAVQNDGESYYAALYGKGAGGHIQLLGDAPLSGGMAYVVNMVVGTLWGAGMGVYIDEVLEDGTVATEVLRAHNGQLALVATEYGGEDVTYTYRSYESLCADIDGDGTVEIPVPEPLPGQGRSEEIEPVLLTKYLHITEAGFETVSHAVENAPEGYRLTFPESWVGRVTAVNTSVSRELRFYAYSPELDGLGAELLRIRVYAQRDYQDRFTDNYFLLAEDGVFLYYAFIPQASGEPLAVSRAEVERLFKLI